MILSAETFRPNFTCVERENIVVWFSYQTPIAFSVDGKLTIRKNDWGPTTGKHLNAINDNKLIRIDGDEFEQLWDELNCPE